MTSLCFNTVVKSGVGLRRNVTSGSQIIEYFFFFNFKELDFEGLLGLSSGSQIIEYFFPLCFSAEGWMWA